MQKSLVTQWELVRDLVSITLENSRLVVLQAQVNMIGLFVTMASMAAAHPSTHNLGNAHI